MTIELTLVSIGTPKLKPRWLGHARSHSISYVRIFSSRKRFRIDTGNGFIWKPYEQKR